MRRLALLLACTFAATVAATPLAAQSSTRGWGITLAGGGAWQPDGDDDHLSMRGAHGAAAVGVRLHRRVVLRLEGLSTGFAYLSNHVHGTCPVDAGPFGCHEPVGPVRLDGFTLGVLRPAGGIDGRTYAGLGAGAYRLSDHPRVERRTLAGAYGVAGYRLTSGVPALVLEGQVHWVPGIRDSGTWSVPLRLGLTF